MRLCWGLVVALSIVGCADEEAPVIAQSTSAAAPAPVASAAVTLPIAEVIAAVVVLNEDQVALSSRAAERATRNEVRAFAARMAREHGEALDRVKTLVGSEGPLAVQLNAEGRAVQSQVDATVGANFDDAYVNAQVSAHAKALGLVENVFLPSATSSAHARSELMLMKESARENLGAAIELQR